MPLTRRWTTSAAYLLAVAILLATAVMSAAPARAQSGNAVTFGDSYTASPDQFINFAATSSGSSGSSGSSVPGSSGSSTVENYPSRGNCLQSPMNWPRQMAAHTGLEVVDWSCTAETSQSMLFRIDEAIRFGDINPSTRAVFFAIGGNDFGPYGLLEGAPVLDHQAMSDRFTANMHAAAAKVRAVAPNARLVLAGYPEVTNGHGICVLQVIPQVPLGIPVPGHAVEGALRDMQRNAAASAGMVFVDNYALTAGHNTCSTNDSQRYVAGMIDTTSPDYTMAMHPTDLGHRALAVNNAAAIGF